MDKVSTLALKNSLSTHFIVCCTIYNNPQRAQRMLEYSQCHKEKTSRRIIKSSKAQSHVVIRQHFPLRTRELLCQPRPPGLPLRARSRRRGPGAALLAQSAGSEGASGCAWAAPTAFGNACSVTRLLR